jgi:hypothetical protein
VRDWRRLLRAVRLAKVGFGPPSQPARVPS